MLAYCDSARAFSRDFAQRELAAHMLADTPDPAAAAATAAAFFGDFTRFKSHGRRISREEAEAVGIKIVRLEDDPDLQGLVRSVHHAIRHTFGIGVAKLVENQHGRAYIESQQQVVIGVQGSPPGLGPIQPGPPVAPSPAPEPAGAPPGRPVSKASTRQAPFAGARQWRKAGGAMTGLHLGSRAHRLAAMIRDPAGR